MFNFGSGKETGAGNSSYDESHPLNGIKNELTYQNCQDIFNYWPLGRRVVSALPNFALNSGRKISFGEFPKECIDRFNEVFDELNLLEVIKNHCYNIRIFGNASLLVQFDEKDYEKPVSLESIRNSKFLRVIPLTPMITAGSQIGMNPLEKDYLLPIQIKVNGQNVNPSRVLWSNNGMPQYLKWVPSGYNYTGQSVFSNMVEPIKYWGKALIALQRIATKAGGIIVKNRQEGSLLNSIVVNSTNKFMEVIRNMNNDGIASISHQDSVELFNLNGTSEVELIINKFNEVIQLALTDTPTAILLDERLAKGFGNGEEDFKALLIAVDNYRNNILKSIYEWLDKIVLYRAFDNDFISSLSKKYSFDVKNKDEFLLKIIDEFSYEWEPLYPDSEANKQDNLGRKLDNLMKLKELGATLGDIEEIINSDDSIFNQEITLEEPEPQSEEESYLGRPSEVSNPSGDMKQDK